MIFQQFKLLMYQASFYFCRWTGSFSPGSWNCLVIKTQIIKDNINIYFYIIDRLGYMSTFYILVILLSLFLHMFFDAAQIGYKYVFVVIIPRIWIVCVTACVYQGKISAAAGLEPDTPVPWVSQWAWRHNISIIFIVNINQSPILYRLCRSLIKWISGDIYRPMPSKLMRRWTNLQRWFLNFYKSY